MLEMIDIIVSTPKRRTEPSKVLAAVHKFLDLYVNAWGFEWTTSKYHWPLHRAEFLQKMHAVFTGPDEWGGYQTVLHLSANTNSVSAMPPNA